MSGMHTAKVRLVIHGAVSYAGSEAVVATRGFEVSGDVDLDL
jgi:hypothetical protein